MKAQEPDYKLYDAVADGLEKADGIVRAAVKSVKNRTWLFAEKYAKEPFLYIMGSGAAYASALWICYLLTSGDAVDGLLLLKFSRIFPWTI